MITFVQLWTISDKILKPDIHDFCSSYFNQVLPQVGPGKPKEREKRVELSRYIRLMVIQANTFLYLAEVIFFFLFSVSCGSTLCVLFFKFNSKFVLLEKSLVLQTGSQVGSNMLQRGRRQDLIPVTKDKKG